MQLPTISPRRRVRMEPLSGGLSTTEGASSVRTSAHRVEGESFSTGWVVLPPVAQFPSPTTQMWYWVSGDNFPSFTVRAPLSSSFPLTCTGKLNNWRQNRIPTANYIALIHVYISHAKCIVYNSVSQPLWECGPVNSFFYKTRARSQQIYSYIPFQFFKVLALN